MDVQQPALASAVPMSGGGSSTSMSFSSGAIQIVVQKGENIDENKLAQKVRQVISDLKREGGMRGGTV